MRLLFTFGPPRPKVSLPPGSSHSESQSIQYSYERLSFRVRTAAIRSRSRSSQKLIFSMNWS